MSNPVWGGIAAVIWAVILWNLRRHFLLFWFLALPGVILHELAHWFAARISNGRPGSIHLWPKRVLGGYILGSVPIHNARWYNGGFIGLAPLLLIPGALLMLRWGIPQRITLENAWEGVCAVYVAGVCLVEFWPSPWDWRIVGKSFFWLCSSSVSGGGSILGIDRMRRSGSRF